MIRRCGTIGIAGRPNTGKSSLMNALVGEKLSIVSPKPQTTRHLVTGILTRGDCQYVFIDAPGRPLAPRSVLQRVLERRAGEAAREADVAMLVVEARRFGPQDHAALERVPAGRAAVAAVNKIDLVKNRSELIPFLDRLSKLRDWHAIVPVSARTGENLAALLEVLRLALPQGPAIFPPDQLTDRDERFLAAELLREKLYRGMRRELPYRCEVAIESFRQERGLRRIEATVLVERESQKAIVIGARGERLKRMASAARRDMERMFGGKVYLGVWVKVRRAWSDDERVLRGLGYG
jgi:GTP-binding protein Era